MVNMKDIAVCYDKISAFDMLVDIAKVAGVESIQAALDEISAQQSVHPTLLTADPTLLTADPTLLTAEAICPRCCMIFDIALPAESG